MNGAEKDTVIMVATDVVALFPSLGIDEMARVCGLMAERSALEIEGVDYCEMLLYIRLNEEQAGDLGNLVNFLPTRKSRQGSGPTMRNSQVKGPWHQEALDNEKLLWVHKPPPRNFRLRRRIFEIGIGTLFTTFAYTFVLLQIS